MYWLLLFILPCWLRLFLSLAHISIWLCCYLNESFCTLIGEHCISNFDHVKVFHFGWFYSPVVISDRCCSRHLLHMRDFDPISFVPSAGGLFASGWKNKFLVSFWSGLQTVLSQRLSGSIIVCICVRANVWIISPSISICLAPDIDRCLQEASSGPHGTLDHVGQIYGLMLLLTTRHPATGDISEANRCNLSCLAQSQHFIGSFAFKGYWLHLELIL